MRSEDCGCRVGVLGEDSLIISGGTVDTASYCIPSSSRVEPSALFFDFFVPSVVKEPAL